VLHSVPAQKAAIDGGKMDGWENIPDGTCDAATGYRCVGGYKPSQIPNIAALASDFAVSDKTFSEADSPSWAGHMAAVAASEDNFTGDQPIPAPGVQKNAGWGCDSNKMALWYDKSGNTQYVPSCVPAAHLPGVPFGGAFRKTPVKPLPTIMDRLSAAGLSWNIYGAVKGAQGYGKFDICPTFATCLDTTQDKRLVPDAQFMTDAAAGTLPSFSVVTAGGPDDLDNCHNMLSMTACDDFIGQVVGAAEKSPDWSSTAIFLTWDDCGCFYDQVPPPVEPDGTQEGPRVPMVIISPYARPGYTDNTATTFNGVLAFTERTFGLAPLGVNDAGAYDFRKAFNYAQTPLRPVHMKDRPLPPSAKRIKLTPALENDPT
jgi:phospholipase C